MTCIKCNFKGQMVPKKRGPHVGYYCPVCGCWQGKWLSKEEKTLLAINKIEIIPDDSENQINFLKEEC